MKPTILQGDVRETLRSLPRTVEGRFVRGFKYSEATQFKKGEHWRESKPWWNRDWLFNEYVTLEKSAEQIANEVNCKRNNILFWLAKHGIPRRSMREVRSKKHWGLSGATNGMFGMTRERSPNWKGGLTPARQRVYASATWRSVVRALNARDRHCRMCGSSGPLEVHHIMPFAKAPLLAFDIGNLIRLCKLCHNKVRNKEMRYAKKLLALLEGGEAGV